MSSHMTYVGKSLICTITLVLLDRRHSQLVNGSWMRRGATDPIHMIIVCFDNPKNLISLTTSTLLLILVVDRLVFFTTFLCHIFAEIESVRSVPRLSINFIFFTHNSESLNSFDEFGTWSHMSIRAISRHVWNCVGDLRLFRILLRLIHLGVWHQRIRTFANFPSFLLLGVPVYNYLVMNKDLGGCLRIIFLLAASVYGRITVVRDIIWLHIHRRQFHI